MRHRIAALGLTLALFSSAPALAFHESESFERSANQGGGASYYYTGSPRFRGYDCNICHTGAEKKISIELTGGLETGRYSEGLVYQVDLRLVGEHRGLGSAFNPNTFTAEIVDAEGNAVGSLRSGGGSLLTTVDDGQVILAEGAGNGENEWRFSWSAPQPAVPATLYIAMLDGDGAGEPVRRFIDPLNDDVATLAVDLCPEGVVCEPREEPERDETSPAGCRAADSSSRPYALLCLLALFFLRSRGHRSSLARRNP